MKRALIPVLFCTLALGQSPSSASATLSSDEYSVYAAAINFFLRAGIASHPLVADHTSTFACDSGCNGSQTGGCNGLRSKSETPSARLAKVQGDLPSLDSSAIRDFEVKNQACSEIAPRIPIKNKYVLFSPSHLSGLPEDWKFQDYFYFSRVGMDSKRNQALVYIGFMSGTDGSDSGGRYFLFEKTDGSWSRKGTSAVWQLNAPQHR
jgi:hypothetical protein